jgi:hypothetical protein
MWVTCEESENIVVLEPEHDIGLHPADYHHHHHFILVAVVTL